MVGSFLNASIFPGDMERISPVMFEAHRIPVVAIADFTNHFGPYMQRVYDGSRLAIERGGFVSGVLAPMQERGYKEITDRLYIRFCREFGIEFDSIDGPRRVQLEFFYERFGNLKDLGVNRITHRPEFRYQHTHFLNIAQYRGEDNFDAYTIITKVHGRRGTAILVPPSVGLEIAVNEAIKEYPKEKAKITV